MPGTDAAPPSHAVHHASFRENLLAALRVWRWHPWLPISSLLIFSSEIVIPRVLDVIDHDRFYACLRAARSYSECHQSPAALAIGFLFLPLAFLQMGWVGTERVWYLRAFRSLPMRPAQAFDYARDFIGRFFVLGLLLSIPIFVGGMISIVLVLGHGIRPGNASWLWPGFVAFAVVDVLFTFVTPALAFSTPRVRAAMRIGMTLLRREWPACAVYVLVPPLAFVVLSQFSGRLALYASVAIPLSIFGTLLNLAFKGATAKFYLEVVPETSDDGAARLQARIPRQAPPA